MILHRLCAYLVCMLVFAPAALPQILVIPADVPVPTQPYIWGQAAISDRVVIVKAYQHTDKSVVIVDDFLTGDRVYDHKLPRIADPKIIRYHNPYSYGRCLLFP